MHVTYHTDLDVRKPVYRVSDQVRLKPACSATETSYDGEILPVSSLMIANNKGADQPAHPCRLVCAFVVCLRQSPVFLSRGPYVTQVNITSPQMRLISRLVFSYYSENSYVMGTNFNAFNEMLPMSAKTYASMENFRSHKNIAFLG